MARRAGRAVPSAEPVEGPWELPAGWWWERLGGLGDWFGGGTPSKANSAFWTGGSIPWVSAKDMKSDYIDDTEDHITEEAVENSSAKRIPAGSVLCVMRSGILQHSFPVTVTRREVTINQDLRALYPRSDVDPAFVAYFLRRASHAILHECSKDGTTVTSIETNRLMALAVPITDLSTQRSMIVRIEALFEEIAEGERLLMVPSAGMLPDLIALRRSILVAAFRGGLR